uniref:Uncharacterized protein n=1 Tax=Romanomermis culicivorax TaxID=13658 RepID=A0A915JHK3_ROMCU
MIDPGCDAHSRNAPRLRTTDFSTVATVTLKKITFGAFFLRRRSAKASRSFKSLRRSFSIFSISSSSSSSPLTTTSSFFRLRLIFCLKKIG